MPPPYLDAEMPKRVRRANGDRVVFIEPPVSEPTGKTWADWINTGAWCENTGADEYAMADRVYMTENMPEGDLPQEKFEAIAKIIGCVQPIW